MSIDAIIGQALPQASPPRQEATAAKAAAAVEAPAINEGRSAAKPAPTLDQVHAAAEQIERYLKSSGRALDFHVDNDTGRVVVVVRDAASGDLIRQMPSEEALHLARTLSEGAKSLVELTA